MTLSISHNGMWSTTRYSGPCFPSSDMSCASNKGAFGVAVYRAVPQARAVR
jgi:hypothetical protein